MAWRCSGATNREMIDNLVSAGIVKTLRVKEALLRVDRGNYVRSGSSAYQDSPQPIGHSVTISAPHMHAECLERLHEYLTPSSRALDLGSGSGYLTAAFKHMVGSDGVAFGVECVEPLVPWSEENLRKDGFGKDLDNGSLRVVAGDGSKGWEQDKTLTFHAIHVGAAAPALPKPLVDALAAPGRMLIPVGVDEQYLQQVDKDEHGVVTVKNIIGVRYVPFHMSFTEAFHP